MRVSEVERNKVGWFQQQIDRELGPGNGVIVFGLQDGVVRSVFIYIFWLSFYFINIICHSRIEGFFTTTKSVYYNVQITSVGRTRL